MAKDKQVTDAEKVNQDVATQQAAEATQAQQAEKKATDEASKEEVSAAAAEATAQAAKPNKNQAKKDEKAARIADIKERFKTDTVWENSKGEFFTSENLALLSEGNDKTKVTTHR